MGPVYHRVYRITEGVTIAGTLLLEADADFDLRDLERAIGRRGEPFGAEDIASTEVRRAADEIAEAEGVFV